MDGEEVRSFNQLLVLSFLVVSLRLIYLNSYAFLPILLSRYTIREITFYRNILDVFGILLSVGVVVAGYWFGKKADLVNHYKDYIRGIEYSWILVVLLAAAGWFFIYDFLRSLFEVAFVRGLAGYAFLAPFFSGITLGWLVEERFTVQPVWSDDILRYVLIYQGAVLIQSLIRVYLSKTMLYSGSPPALFGLYLFVLSSALIPFGLWFLWKMDLTGKTVELGLEYGSILFTLWVPRIVVRIISSVLEMIVIGQTDVVEWLFQIGTDLISRTIDVFGIAFAALCFGYIHSRYVHGEIPV